MLIKQLVTTWGADYRQGSLVGQARQALTLEDLGGLEIETGENVR